jgi:DNA-binding CsgD family transcriptional regulator
VPDLIELIEHHLMRWPEEGDDPAERLVDEYLGLTARRRCDELSKIELSRLAGALARERDGDVRATAVAIVRALESWTAPVEPAAEPVEQRARELVERLERHSVGSRAGLRRALELMDLAPHSTLAFWHARRRAALLLEEPGVRDTPLGERAWTNAAEILSMADGDRRLAEQVAHATARAGRRIAGDRITLLRRTWLMLRLEWFEPALAQLAWFRGHTGLGAEDLSFADALQAYALAATGPADQAIALGERALSGSGIGAHLGASVVVRTCVRERRLDEARAVLERVPPVPQPPSIGATALLIARGMLDAHDDRPTEALDALGPALEHLRRVGNRNPSGWPWLEPTVRALVGLSQRAQAAAVLGRARHDALRWGTPIVLAELHRASAWLEPTREAAGAARRSAVRTLEESPARLEYRWARRELDGQPTDAPRLEALTPRVREVAELVAAGLRDREIADRLQLSPRTVHRHVATALATTGARNRVDLAVMVGAQRTGGAAEVRVRSSARKPKK